MRGGRYGPADYARMAAAVVVHDRISDLGESAGRVWQRWRPDRPKRRALPWGWKNRTGTFLLQLIDRFGGLRYVYMVRHGLDMAYSRNRTQLRRKHRFGVPVPADRPGSRARRSSILDRRHPARSTWEPARRALHRRAYEALCDDPERELGRVLELAGLTWARAAVAAGRRGAQARCRRRWRERGDRAFQHGAARGGRVARLRRALGRTILPDGR
jgi:hypothetical protein